MKRATLLLIGSLLAISVLLGACGGGGTGGPTSIPTLQAATLPAGSPAAPSGPSGASGGDQVAQGQQLSQQNGCLGCHSTDGTNGTGPTWKGLADSQVKLADGSTVTADDNYLKESIVNPSAQIVQGYQDIMPKNFGQTLNDQQIQAIVAYIKSLK